MSGVNLKTIVLLIARALAGVGFFLPNINITRKQPNNGHVQAESRVLEEEGELEKARAEWLTLVKELAV